jgi:DNA-binding NtrC family response regulator
MRPDRLGQLVGTSDAVAHLRLEIERVARTDLDVLIMGEPGAGKEFVARQIHAASARAGRAFVSVNCARLPDTALEGELFGHIPGGAVAPHRRKLGKLEMADGETIFLDEIGAMTPRIQGLLLRFLETGEVPNARGDGRAAPINVRIITSTSRNLPELIALGQFRERLFYRLNVIDLPVPPLGARKADVPALVEHFLGELCRPNRHRVTPEAMAALAEHSWPGNVRQLQGVVKEIVLKVRSGTIAIEDIPSDICALHSADDLYRRVVAEHQSFWTTVYPLFMHGQITRAHVCEIVSRGLQEARGNYKIVARMFNMEARGEYLKFLSFLRNHQCQPSFREFRC